MPVGLKHFYTLFQEEEKKKEKKKQMSAEGGIFSIRVSWFVVSPGADYFNHL